MSPQDAGNRNASAPDVREAFLAWIRDDGYLVPSAVTDIEWDDEGLPVYYTRDDGVRHYLDGEWHAWQAATARAALASPVAAPVSPPAASRDAVAEVLLHEAHPDLAPWSLLQLSGHNAAGIVCAVALARRQADAILSRWSAPPAPRGEAVAWFVEDKDGYAPTRPTFDEFEADAERRELDRTDPENAPHRVVALVPKHEEEAP